MTQMPLNQTELMDLAPQQLEAKRDGRYLGEGYGVSIDVFAPRDQTIIKDVYAVLLELFEFLKDRKGAPERLKEIKQWVVDHNWQQYIYDLQSLGNDTKSYNDSELVRQVIHDVRGGSLAALSVTLQLLLLDVHEHTDPIHMFFLTRDHLKIMRNAIPDLDPERTQKDRTDNRHHIQLMVEKWTDSHLALHDQQADIKLDCQFNGDISERCMEFSALDRVVYNIMNNAVRFTADHTVYFSIFGLEDAEHPQNVRFVVCNQITEDHHQTLRTRFGDQTNQVFGTDFTTGGSGMGMAICAGFVANAYGLNSIERALNEGYCGAKIINDTFVTWFHWPVVAD